MNELTKLRALLTRAEDVSRALARGEPREFVYDRVEALDEALRRADVFVPKYPGWWGFETLTAKSVRLGQAVYTALHDAEMRRVEELETKFSPSAQALTSTRSAA